MKTAVLILSLSFFGHVTYASSLVHCQVLEEDKLVKAVTLEDKPSLRETSVVSPSGQTVAFEFDYNIEGNFRVTVTKPLVVEASGKPTVGPSDAVARPTVEIEAVATHPLAAGKSYLAVGSLQVQCQTPLESTP